MSFNSGDCINETAARLSLARQCFELAAYESELNHLQQAKRWLEQAMQLADRESKQKIAVEIVVVPCAEGPRNCPSGRVMIVEDDGYPD